MSGLGRPKKPGPPRRGPRRSSRRGPRSSRRGPRSWRRGLVAEIVLRVLRLVGVAEFLGAGRRRRFDLGLGLGPGFRGNVRFRRKFGSGKSFTLTRIAHLGGGQVGGQVV